jgi:hypothetical protein
MPQSSDWSFRRRWLSVKRQRCLLVLGGCNVNSVSSIAWHPQSIMHRRRLRYLLLMAAMHVARPRLLCVSCLVNTAQWSDVVQAPLMVVSFTVMSACVEFCFLISSEFFRLCRLVIFLFRLELLFFSPIDRSDRYFGYMGYCVHPILCTYSPTNSSLFLSLNDEQRTKVKFTHL